MKPEVRGVTISEVIESLSQDGGKGWGWGSRSQGLEVWTLLRGPGEPRRDLFGLVEKGLWAGVGKK